MEGNPINYASVVKYMKRLGQFLFLPSILLLSALLLPLPVFSAASDDVAQAVAVDSSGNVYVTGHNYDPIGGDWVTAKYNNSGVLQWIRKYNGPGNNTDWPYALAVDTSSNVYVTGYSTGSGTGADITTIKYNSAGTVQWVRRYNGPISGVDIARDIAIDSTGNVYVTGYSYGTGTVNDYVTIKYSNTGVLQWVRRYNGPGNSSDSASSIALDGSGNVFVTGQSTGSGTGYDYATTKYNNAGVLQWVRRYNTP